MDRYKSFYELAQQEEIGIDYQIVENNCKSDILILAPHGGNIEFGTTEVAEALAGNDYGFYSFMGLREDRQKDLHLTSHNFDEPRALERVKNSQSVLTIHGFREGTEIIYLGGLDQTFKYYIAKALHEEGFLVKRSNKYKGSHVNNICNLGKRGMGVQIEISTGLRKQFFKDLRTFQGRKEKLPLFFKFVNSLRSGINRFKEIDNPEFVESTPAIKN